MIVVVMGVAGSGKTTIGKKLASRLGLLFRDADKYHSEANIEKMKRGEPLTDEDRLPWLSTIAHELVEWIAQGGAVLACSALKEKHREILCGQGWWDVRFVYLKGSKEVIEKRMGDREHFFSPQLLQSQLDILEEPENAITVSIDSSIDEICEHVVQGLGKRTHVLLLAGKPGIGKTTIIRQVSDELKSQGPLVGFLTEEMRYKEKREGFKITSFDEEEEIFAHVNFQTRHRVGKYCVDVRALERVIRRSLSNDEEQVPVVIDEIGKMECFSRDFVDKMEHFIESGRLVVATIAHRGTGFIQRVKKYPVVELWTVNDANRDEMAERVLQWLVDRQQVK